METLKWTYLLIYMLENDTNLLNLTKSAIKENKEIKVKKISGKSQPNFQHYFKKIEPQAKNGFLIKKTPCTSSPKL